MTDYIMVQFSGGKDSTAMLLHMIELGDHIDEVVNIDVGMEFDEMYNHIEKIKKIVEDNGIKYTTLRSKWTFEYWMLEKPINSKKYGSKKGYGWPSVQCRWCTSEMKIKLMRPYLKELKNQGYNVIQCIGLAADEYKRLERKNNQDKNHRHPLVEWGWSEKICLDYCYSLGYDWGGLYKLFDRVSCWCCPFSGLDELRSLWLHFPEKWKKLEEWESIMLADEIGRDFRFKEKTTVFDLSKRFEYEQSRIDKGLSIRSRGFYDQYRKIRNPLPESQKTLELGE